MLNNLVSHQLPISSMQMSQLDPIVSKVDSLGRDSQIGLVDPGSSNPMSQQQETPNNHGGLLRAVPGDPGSHEFSMPIGQSRQIDSHASSPGIHQLVAPIEQPMQMEMRLNSVGPKQLSTMPKRKAATEPLSGSAEASNKRVAQMDRPWLQHVSNTPHKGSVQMHPLSNAPGLQNPSASSRRKTQTEFSKLGAPRSMESSKLGTPRSTESSKSGTPRSTESSKSGTPRSLSSKNQNAQVQQSSKNRTESSESVRSKMRESLAAALALVSQHSRLHDEKNNTGNETGNSQVKLDNSSQCSSAATDAALGQTQEVYRSGDSYSAVIDSFDNITKDVEYTNSEIGCTKMLHFPHDSNCDKQDFQSSYTLTTDDVPFSDTFFVKDELLQGNGLSWVLDSEMVDMSIEPEIQTNQDQRLEHDVGSCVRKQTINSPELLASEIEAELFKLFGGVNKKYKEKGRSLLFNLKDRNNPELRERVMSGEIPPERLCSMTAEELASKELSQWRIAKAEELAQMVVLPDSDVDIRRLVKKTHKGEFQVEVEHEDNLSVEVSGGKTLASQSRTERKDVEGLPSKVAGIEHDVTADVGKSNLRKDNSLTVSVSSNDGAVTQGLAADDALKDADFLPPIVSLDEFMEAQHSKSSVENSVVEPGKVAPTAEKDNPVVGTVPKSSDVTTRSGHTGSVPNKSDVDHKTSSSVDAVQGKGAEAESDVIPPETRSCQSHADIKQSDPHPEVRLTAEKKSASPRELKASQSLAEEKCGGSYLLSQTAVSTVISKSEFTWQGMLQLNISTTHSVISIFKSGEKTSLKEWPGFLEIKGRVRLDAFEKFLQELPLSRTRAIMVMHFVSKEDCPENEKSILREVADSYILDERVGFAEPAPGVELYFCPPHKKTVEMLSKILPMEQIEAVNSIDYGLIGINVWRKTHSTSTISPTSSSHHKHSSKKQYLSTRRQQDTNVNANQASKAEPTRGFANTQSGPSDDDDIPPGFGPAAARDEDDLPEFNFSGGSNPSHSVHKPLVRPVTPQLHTINQTSRPVDQMRELVQKYGQGQVNASGSWHEKFGATIQPWNDEDDDIPEWQPQTSHNQFHPQHNFQPPPHMLNHSYGASQSFLQAPMNMTPDQSNLRPVMVPPSQRSNLQPPPVGHAYGAPAQAPPWHQNVPRSRGF